MSIRKQPRQSVRKACRKLAPSAKKAVRNPRRPRRRPRASRIEASSSTMKTVLSMPGLLQGFDRKYQKEAAALAYFKYQAPAVRLGDGSADGEAKAKTARLGGDERFEYPVRDIGRQARTAVLDADGELVSAF